MNGPLLHVLTRRPALLVAAIVVLMFGAGVLRVALALDDGLGDATAGGRQWLYAFERFRSESASTLPLAMADDLRRTAGVADVIPETRARVRGADPTSLVLIRGVDLRDLRRLGAIRAGAEAAVAEWLGRNRRTRPVPRQPTANNPAAAVMGRLLARRVKRNKGDLWQVPLDDGGTITVLIVEIADSGSAENESFLFVEREALVGRHQVGQTCSAYRILPTGGESLAQLKDRVERAFSRYSPGLRVLSGDELARRQLRPISGLSRVVRTIGLTAFFASLAVFAWLMMMALDRRVRDLAVMQLVGANARGLARRVVAEAFCIGLVAGYLGAWISMQVLAATVPVFALGDGVVELPHLPETTALVVLLVAFGTAGASVWPARWANQRAAGTLLHS